MVSLEQVKKKKEGERRKDHVNRLAKSEIDLTQSTSAISRAHSFLYHSLTGDRT